MVELRQRSGEGEQGDRPGPGAGLVVRCLVLLRQPPAQHREPAGHALAHGDRLRVGHSGDLGHAVLFEVAQAHCAAIRLVQGLHGLDQGADGRPTLDGLEGRDQGLAPGRGALAVHPAAIGATLIAGDHPCGRGEERPQGGTATGRARRLGERPGEGLLRRVVCP